jgi:hypothetical protein
VAIKFIELEDGNAMLLRAISRELKINLFLSYTSKNVYTARLLDLFFPQDANEEDPNTIKSIYLVMDFYEHTLDDILSDNDANLDK